MENEEGVSNRAFNCDNVLEDIKRFGYATIILRNGSFTVEPRPVWCNRGAWLVKVFPDPNQCALYIDEADMFPRYYFDFDNMVSELELWIKKNEQNIK